MINRTASLLAMLLVAVLLAACDGAASPTPATTGATSPSPTAAATPSEAPTEAPTSAAATDGTGFGPDIDLGAAAAALEGIDSYRISMTTEGAGSVAVEAVVVRSPQAAQQYTITVGPSSQRLILIGEQAWMDPGTGTYAPVPAEVAAGLSSSFDPAVLVGSFNNPMLRMGLESVGRETRNGVETSHYRLDATSPVGQMASLQPGAEMDLWLADEGYLVAFEARGMDPSVPLIRMDVTHINDPTNIVEAPS